MSGLRASAKGGDSKRIDNVELIPTDFQLCTLYGIIDLGTQPDDKFGPAHKVNLAFEFPEHFRVYYEGNESQPASIFVTETLSMHEKSNLRKRMVQPMNGSIMTDNEAEEFDISSLLGKHFVASISHSPDGKWANIQSITPLTEQNRKLFSLEEASVKQINPTAFFTLEQGFESDNFAKLNNNVREKLINSQEGKEYALSGGKFAEKVKRDIDGGVQSPNAPQGKLIMVDDTYTYKQMIDAGWTDEGLIAEGKARLNNPAPPPTPVVEKLPPSPPSKKPVLVMKNPALKVADWLAQGWTEEQLVEEGHGTFQ